MQQIALLLTTFALLTLTVFSQTITTTNAGGQTIVEVITEDPVLGVPSTQILQTLTTTAPQVATTTTPDVQQGPVGQPAATNAAGQSTVYTYTTTDALGNTIAVIDTFTPTFPQTVVPTPTTTGTILDYSQWLSMVGTNTISPKASTATRWNLSQGLLSAAFGVLGSMLGGAWLVLF